ncbi:response regulator transcription factor [Adlercreutzia sp. ZJ138]|uniref:response regulator transcription factor n=1 Tax=Adlercreutzia sp. ZJ138 TaxID=2709405 RepID=UPI0013ECA938|nr:LuxR family transcriptional regulator [Adlercreutzia sp. ZJ138]
MPRCIPLNPLSLGFGLCWGIQLVLLFSRTLFGSDGRGADLFNYALGISIAVAALAVFVAAQLYPTRFNNTHSTNFCFMVLTYGALLMVGTVLILVTLFASEQYALQIAGGLFAGFGLCISYITWIKMIACHSADQIRSALSISFCTGIVLFVLLAWAPPVPRIFCITTAAVVSCALGLSYAKTAEHPEALGQPNNIIVKLDNLATCVAVSTVGFAYGASGFLSLNSPSAIQQNTIVWHLCLLIVSFLLFVAITQFLPRQASISLLFQIVFPLVVVAMGILPFAPVWYWDIYNFIVAGSFQLAEMILFFSFATSAIRIVNLKAVCLPLAGMWFGINAGLLFGNQIFAGSFDRFFTLSALVIAIFCSFSLAMFILALVWRQQALTKPNSQPANNTLSETAEPVSTDNTPIATTPNRDPLIEVQLSIQLTYELTDREAEIMGYIAKGRSSTFISERLYLSPNTVRGYIRTAYAKLNIHSKQEAIDLFERELEMLEKQRL